MILVRGSPFGPMLAVRDEMHRLFHGTFGQVRGDGATGVTGIWEPPVNIYETDDALVLQVELPGVSKDVVSCSVTLGTPSGTYSTARAIGPHKLSPSARKEFTYAVPHDDRRPPNGVSSG
jgi:hypothetical protein